MGTLDFPTAGEVRIFGESITPRVKLDRLRNLTLGFVFQLHNLLPNLTLAENVMLAMYPRRISRKAARERADELLARVGLTARRDFLPVQVSAGERQRTAAARALANDPRIILADEPTGSLDSRNGQAVLELLLSLASDGERTLVVVTHDAEIARRLGRSITLVDGKIV